MAGNKELAQRVKAYFARQTAWFEKALAEFESPDVERSSDELAQLVAKHTRRATETSGFDAECKELLAQWDAARDLSPEDRAEVQRAARRAQVLGRELEARYGAAGQAARQRMKAVKNALGALGRGRGFLRKYRPEQGPASGHMVDKNG
jgi:hypothetical protein